MLIVTVVALSDFFIKNFPHVSWYPYWYLGNPYQYLIGPVVPATLAIVQSVNFKVQSYEIYFFLILGSFLIGALGLYSFLRVWGAHKKQAVASALLYVILPASWFILSYQNGLHHIAFGFLPWVLVFFERYLEQMTVKRSLFLSIAIAFELLITTSILLPIIIGFVAVFVAIRIDLKQRANHEREIERIILKTTGVILLALSLATFWYAPSFWWTQLFNPSFGGLSLVKLIEFLFQLILQLFPIILAVVFVKWRHARLSSHLLFGLLFFSSFFFLSVVRFLFDPDFVMDWISYFIELQFGLSIVLGSLLAKIEVGNLVQNSKLKVKSFPSRDEAGSLKFKILNFELLFFTLHFALLTYLLILLVSTGFDIWTLSKLRNQLRSGYQLRIISILKNHVKEEERVFLSGSSAFFANLHLNIQQVRGGRDEVSIHPMWAHGAYQIREGEDKELAKNWLKALGASYVLVHEKGSDEPFHDFKHPEKFTSSRLDSEDFGLIVSNHKDKLYKVSGAYLARVAAREILEVERPKNGADRIALDNYVSHIKREAHFDESMPGKILINETLDKGEVISLAISYDPRWKVGEGEGEIIKDGLGNMVILPKSSGRARVQLIFARTLGDFLIPALFVTTLVPIFFFFDSFYVGLHPLFFHLSIGIEDDEDY